MLERELRPHKMKIYCVFSAQIYPGAPPLLGMGRCAFRQQCDGFVAHFHDSENLAVGAPIRHGELLAWQQCRDLPAHWRIVCACVCTFIAPALPLLGYAAPASPLNPLFIAALRCLNKM